MPQTEINVLAIIKGKQRFVFLYDDASVNELVETFGEYAANPDLEFSWHDAAMMAQKVRKLQDRIA